MPGPLRDSGIPPLGQVPWGSHFCLFYDTAEDLTEVVVPYLAAGLETNELCFWLVAEPLTEQSAREAFRRTVPDLDRYDAKGAVRFASAPEWLLRGGRIDVERISGEWLRLLAESEKGGFAGLRAAGCQAWMQRAQWDEFHRYERALEETVSGKAILALCSYPLQTTDAAGVLDVADSHDVAIAKREGKWAVVETPTLRLQQLDQRNRQQTAISKLGLCAIEERNIGVVINEATSLAAETLGTGRSLLWQLRPEHDDIVLRAKAGWDDLPEETILPLGKGAVKQAIERNQPVAIFDIQDPQFEKSWVLRDYGVATMMTAIIRGQQRPWGILSVHSLTPRSFSRDDLGFLQSMADVLALAIERDAYEAAERREKETLQTIFDNVPVMISFSDASQRLVRANPEWQRALGWTAEEAASMDIFAELFPDPALREFAREFINRPDRGWRDFQVQTRAGQTLETSWARFSLSDHSSILVALDVTKRKRAEEHFRELAENINEAFWVLSGDREELLYLNPAGERLTGYSQLSLGGPRGWLKTFHPDDRPHAWRAVSGDEKATQEDLRIVRPNGTIRWTRLKASWIQGPSGEVFRVCGITTDVTDRREAENERARLLTSQTEARAVAERALQRLHAIESITDAALGRMSFDDLLSELFSRLRHALQTEEAGVVLLNEQRTGFVVHSSEGTILSKFAGVAVPLDSPVAGRVMKEGRAVIVDDVASADAPQWQKILNDVGVSAVSAMGAPMMVEGTLTGVVIVASEKGRKFTEDDLELLRVVADRVAPAIERNRLMEVVHAGRERLESLSRRLLTVQEEQRRRVAIELHDELGQILTAVKIDLHSTPAKVADAADNVDRAMRTVRDLALELRPAMLDDLGLAAALRWYADRFAQQTGVKMHIAIEEVRDLTFERATSAFRVAQEALTNIARHAAAKNVWLDLHCTPSALEVAIRDDGTGFDVDAARDRAAHGASLGIAGMQERASLAGGTLEIRSTPGKGTEIRARFPAEDRQ
jgi:PAS domain S-box-containing protein